MKQKQAMVSFRLDTEVKKSMEEVCKDMGISMSTAFSIFAHKVCRERRIPFEITASSEAKNIETCASEELVEA